VVGEEKTGREIWEHPDERRVEGSRRSGLEGAGFSSLHGSDGEGE